MSCQDGCAIHNRGSHQLGLMLKGHGYPTCIKTEYRLLGLVSWMRRQIITNNQNVSGRGLSAGNLYSVVPDSIGGQREFRVVASSHCGKDEP